MLSIQWYVDQIVDRIISDKVSERALMPDITLVTNDGRQMRAHKLVLGLQCDELLSRLDQQIVELDDVILLLL
jgi:hypothetical protein